MMLITLYPSVIFFLMLLTLLSNSSLSDIFFSIFLTPCIMVVWSFPPRSLPTSDKEASVRSLHKYITTCLGSTSSAFLFLLVTSETVTLYWSHTLSNIYEGVMSTGLSGYTMSFRASSAFSILISTFLSFE